MRYMLRRCRRLSLSLHAAAACCAIITPPITRHLRYAIAAADADCPMLMPRYAADDAAASDNMFDAITRSRA